MKPLSQFIRREFSLFWQNKIFVVAFLLMPLVIASVLGFVYYKGKVDRLPILVVDEDHSPSSAKLMDMLDENNSLHVTTVRRATVDLEQLMLEKRVAAIVVIPFRFEADLMLKRVPEINCYLNMGNTLSAGVAGGAIQLSVATLNVGVQLTELQKKGIPQKIAGEQYEAFHHNIFQQYNPAGNYLYFLWPGLIFSLLHQLLLLASAAGFSQEFSNNTFGTVLSTYTRSPTKLIIGKILPYLFMSAFTVAAYFFISMYFRIPLPEHLGVLLLAILLFVISTSLLGTFFSIKSPLPLKASQTVMTIGSPAFSISGFAWSSEQIPMVLRALSEIIPLTPMLRAIRLSWIQGATLQDVLPQLYHQAILIVVYFLLSFFLLRKKIKKALMPAPVPVTA